MESINYGVGRF